MEYPKLPPDFKAKWVAALRSGEYAQGHGKLLYIDGNDNKKYCCLGVAAEMCGAGPKRSHGTIHSDSVADIKLIPSILTYNSRHSVTDKLFQMNDAERKTFPEIADWIEENL